MCVFCCNEENIGFFFLENMHMHEKFLFLVVMQTGNLQYPSEGRHNPSSVFVRFNIVYYTSRIFLALSSASFAMASRT